MRKALLDSFIWRGAYFITALVLNICIARIYEATQSGWIYFISNNFYLVVLIGGLSLDSSMTYFSASNKISPDKLALFALSWPSVVALVSIACTGFLISGHYIKSDYLFLLVAGAAYTFGISLTNFFTSLFYAKHNFSAPNILMSAVNVAVIILIPFFAKGFMGLNREQFLYIYFLQFIIQGAGLAILYLILYCKLPFLEYPNKQEYKLLFRFAIIALSANIAHYLINRIDYLFVAAWCPPKSLGNYVQVSKMGQLFLILPAIISSAIYPQAAKSDNSNVVTLILRLTGLFALFYVFIITGSYLFSNLLFILVFGATFDEMFIPFLILLPGILFLSIHTIIAAFFGGKNKPSYNVISTASGLAVVLTGDFLLIKPFGIIGAALVSTLGYTTACIVSMLLFMHKTGTRWREVFTLETFRIKTYTSLISDSPSN